VTAMFRWRTRKLLVFWSITSWH